MFTGLIQHRGTVDSIASDHRGSVLVISIAGWQHVPAFGSSISVNGCCLTVSEPTEDQNSADLEPDTRDRVGFHVVPQTLNLTTLGQLQVGQPVNLEAAVTPATLMGGHIVQGHVDGIGEVVNIDRSDGQWRIRVKPPSELCTYILDQGSIAVDGVSLTIASAATDTFEIALIPTTLDLTTLGGLCAGDRVNLETDYLARVVVNWMRKFALPSDRG